MTKNEAIELFKRYDNGECSEQEKLMVEQWYADWNKTDHSYLSEEDLDDAEMLMRRHLFPQQPVKQIRLWPRIAAAALIILCLSVGGYLLFHNKLKPQIAQTRMHDIAPGGNKAILTIAGGKTIVLTGAVNGKLATQGSMAVNKTAEGELTYHEADDQKTAGTAPVYNTLTTPKGGKYNLTLADGTKVWLDAASSITYPVAFTGNYRQVKITGQAYFEVAHNAAMPFRVGAGGETVEVLGTHFNVMAYQDENIIKTTLLEGAVRVSTNRAIQLLKPGQQAQVIADDVKVTADVDLEDVIAWKEGYFKFNENLESVMAKIARWYDVEIVYEYKPGPDAGFGGKISRSKNLSAVLNIMETTNNVHFRIEGRRVIVMK